MRSKYLWFLMALMMASVMSLVVCAQEFDDDEFFLDDDTEEEIVVEDMSAGDLEEDVLDEISEIEEEDVVDDDEDILMDDEEDLEEEVIEDEEVIDDMEEEVIDDDEEASDDLAAEFGIDDEAEGDVVVDEIDELQDEEAVEEAEDIDSIVESAFEEAVQEGTSDAPDIKQFTARMAEVSLAGDMEISKRYANERHARDLLKEAEEARIAKDYESANAKYELAQGLLGSRRSTALERQMILSGRRECHYQLGVIKLRQRDFKEALKRATTAITLGHPRGQALWDKIDRVQNMPAPDAPPPPQRVSSSPYKTRRKEVISKLRSGREYMQTGEYNLARLKIESVLKLDPANTEAIRLLKKIGQKRLDIATLELEDTKKNMMADVRGTWNPRDYAIYETQDPTMTVTNPVNPLRDAIVAKMKAIQIPQVEFKLANIRDVVDELHMLSIEYDEDEVAEAEKGVNIILNLDTSGGEAASADVSMDDPFADESEVADTGGGMSGEIPITFSARYISLFDVMKIVTQVAGLKYRIEGRVVMIVPLNAPEGEIIFRDYPILPTFGERMDALKDEGVFGGASEERGDFIEMEDNAMSEKGNWKHFFAEMGVSWPDGSKIKYVPSIGMLMVANTADNLTRLEKILAILNVVPSQIEIETRFVEVNQTDIDSLGLEIGLTDDWEMLTKKGQAGMPAATRQRIVMNQNVQNADGSARAGFTTGNRFATDGLLGSLPGIDETAGALIGVDDAILKVSGLLTNPEMNFMLHALEQKGNTDLLSAPKVTTQSGSEATIKVVIEYIYPTEFTVTPIMGTTGAGGISMIVGGIVEPGSFATREVGVILSVLPEVSHDSQMINLSMTPEVVTEPTWKDYGSRFSDPLGNPNILPMPQPFFKSRSVVTTVNIYNGATVMMGGMITEERASVDDRIPFLGDIPLIGRLFHSKYDKSEKRNLLIFVTARLVDPAGRAIVSQENQFGRGQVQ